MLDLSTIHISRNTHVWRGLSVSAMEAVAWLAGEDHTEYPSSCSPVLAAFVRRWSRELATDDERDAIIKPLLPRLVGTAASDEIENRRGWMAVDWLWRVNLPSRLRLAGIKKCAVTFERLREFRSMDDFLSARPLIASAGLAALDSVGSAPLDASRNALHAAYLAYEACTPYVAEDAASTAGSAAAYTSRQEALSDTIRTLQASATDLLDRMIRCGQPSTDNQLAPAGLEPAT